MRKPHIHRRRALPTLCLAATTALALTACGGSGFEEGEEGEAPRAPVRSAC